MTTKHKNLSIENVMESVDKGLYDVEFQRRKVLYRLDHVFDEDKSVKWNHLKVARENELIKNFNDDINKKRYKGQLMFQEDLVHAISYVTELNFKQAEAIYNMAWVDGHSEGYYSVVQIADDLVDLLLTIEECKD